MSRHSLTSIAATLLLPMLTVSCQKEPEAAPTAPPIDVNVAKPLQRDVPIYFDAIGETRGNTEIEIRARVEGFIETIDFEQGKLVKKGDLLYTLDPRPFQAALARAKAALAESEAQRARAQQDVARYEPLVEKNAISRQVYETSVAVEKAAAAAVDASKAMVEQAEIDLSYTRILAPEDGLVGKTEVYAGTLVGRGQSTLLTRISRIDPIHARANISERDYLALSRRRLETGGAPAKEATFQLVLADGTEHKEPGKLVFVDRNVDTRTGTIMFEAAFPNPGNLLRPGQFARVRCLMDTARGALLVPQRAVKEMQGSYHVMVVGADGAVAQRLVTTAERVGSLWRIATGLKADDQVLVDGLQKVRPGMKVAPKVVSIDPDKPEPKKEEPKKPGEEKTGEGRK
ncbi:MAG TPA: efflux RND transporter periplasmic adaptor subunit [Planctomycetota bacterium]|nr:efflux RND transporter periplasmic adaptor subunit [Planctomycetota bacterium]